jgi:hypothetical protein
MRHFAWVLVVPVLWLDSSFAKQEKKKSQPGSSDVEVRFNDESIVRMVILQENIEVATKYGKLSVPSKDIRRIEFGAHLADGLGQKIEGLVQDLGSKSFQDREAAGKRLLALGPKAYAALSTAALGTDLEVSHRAQALIKKLKDQFTAQELVVRENDLIQTVEFPIVGRVVSPALRTRTAYFGEPEIQVSQLRSIRWVGQGGREVVTVDAAKNGNGQWLETTVEVSAGEHLSIRATGEVDLQPGNPGNAVCGPAGFNQGGFVGGRGGFAGGGLNRRQLAGALLGRIGETGEIFLVGNHYQGRAPQGGKLRLQISPSPFGAGATGSYRVTIHLGEMADTGP